MPLHTTHSSLSFQGTSTKILLRHDQFEFRLMLSHSHCSWTRNRAMKCKRVAVCNALPFAKNDLNLTNSFGWPENELTVHSAKRNKLENEPQNCLDNDPLKERKTLCDVLVYICDQGTKCVACYFAEQPFLKATNQFRTSEVKPNIYI